MRIDFKSEPGNQTSGLWPWKHCPLEQQSLKLNKGWPSRYKQPAEGSRWQMKGTSPTDRKSNGIIEAFSAFFWGYFGNETGLIYQLNITKLPGSNPMCVCRFISGLTLSAGYSIPQNEVFFSHDQLRPRCVPRFIIAVESLLKNKTWTSIPETASHSQLELKCRGLNILLSAPVLSDITFSLHHVSPESSIIKMWFNFISELVDSVGQSYISNNNRINIDVMFKESFKKGRTLYIQSFLFLTWGPLVMLRFALKQL